MKNYKEYPVGYNLWNDLQGTHTGSTTIKEMGYVIRKGFYRPMIETPKNAVASGKEMFKALLDQLEKVHDAGFIYSDISRTDFVKDVRGKWHISADKPLYEQGSHLNTQNDYIGWKRHSRAPEFKNACLQGTEYYPTVAGDIYSFAYSIFEAISGDQLRLNFQLDRHWASVVEKSFGCDTEEKKEALQRLLDLCTQVPVYHRIQSCRQLKSTEEYKLLFQDEHHL